MQGIDKVQMVFMKYAEVFLKLAEQSIISSNKVDTGKLSDLEIGVFKRNANSYSLSIGYPKSNPASEYYDFVNKGVRGIKNKSKAPKSPYKYRTLNVSQKMVNNILQWYLRHKNYARFETQTKNLSALQTKRKSLKEVSEKEKLKQIATATAKKIKREGLQRVGFFDDNIPKAFGSQFNADLAKAIGQDVVIQIKEAVNGNNNSK